MKDLPRWSGPRKPRGRPSGRDRDQPPRVAGAVFVRNRLYATLPADVSWILNASQSRFPQRPQVLKRVALNYAQQRDPGKAVVSLNPTIGWAPRIPGRTCASVSTAENLELWMR